MALLVVSTVLLWLAVGALAYVSYQLARQNGRLLLRLEAVEQQARMQHVPQGEGGEKHSRINRDGLPAGAPAPGFRLPRLDGGELALDEYRGQRVLLVFSDPECGPCNALAPRLERLHRSRRDLRVLMVSRGDPAANQAKAAQYGLTFPVVLQRHWETSRAYGMFVTPIGYLIDEQGVIAHDVAVGVEAIVALASAMAYGSERPGAFVEQAA
ncbi:MAG: TlpA family protein disulfide reductase [Anaerolineae bacterium]|nr:TlpA family protein disulfide reductase [Anaerolineae bacterium]